MERATERISSTINFLWEHLYFSLKVHSDWCHHPFQMFYNILHLTPVNQLLLNYISAVHYSEKNAISKERNRKMGTRKRTKLLKYFRISKDVRIFFSMLYQDYLLTAYGTTLIIYIELDFLKLFVLCWLCYKIIRS